MSLKTRLIGVVVSTATMFVVPTVALSKTPPVVAPNYDNGIDASLQKLIAAVCGWGVLLCILAAIVSVISLVWASRTHAETGVRVARRGLGLAIIGAAVLATGDGLLLYFTNYAGSLLPS